MSAGSVRTPSAVSVNAFWALFPPPRNSGSMIVVLCLIHGTNKEESAATKPATAEIKAVVGVAAKLGHKGRDPK